MILLNRRPTLEIAFLNAACEGVASLDLAATRYNALTDLQVDLFRNRLEKFHRSCRLGIGEAIAGSSGVARLVRKKAEVENDRSETRLWRAKLRRLVETIHWQFSAEQNQVGFSIRIANSGSIAAKKLRIKLQAFNGVLLCQSEGYGKFPRPGLVLLHLPKPRPYKTLVGGSYLQNDFPGRFNELESHRPPLPRRHPGKFYTSLTYKYLETTRQHECDQFRRTDPPETLLYGAFVGPEAARLAEYSINCVVTADNQAQPIQQSIVIGMTWRDGDTYDRAAKLFTEPNVMNAEEHGYDETVLDWLPGWLN